MKHKKWSEMNRKAIDERCKTRRMNCKQQNFQPANFRDGLWQTMDSEGSSHLVSAIIVCKIAIVHAVINQSHCSSMITKYRLYSHPENKHYTYWTFVSQSHLVNNVISVFWFWKSKLILEISQCSRDIKLTTRMPKFSRAFFICSLESWLA